MIIVVVCWVGGWSLMLGRWLGWRLGRWLALDIVGIGWWLERLELNVGVGNWM